MRNKIMLAFLTVIFSCNVFSHNLDKTELKLREWSFGNNKVSASFLMFKNGLVYLEKENSESIKMPLSSFSKNDQLYIESRNLAIEKLNNSLAIKTITKEKPTDNNKISLVLFLLVAFSLLTFFLAKKNKLSYVGYILTIGVLSILYSFRSKTLQLLSVSTNPISIDSAFVPFKPNVNTFWDATYFHVESIGIPTTHTMMVGISNHGWQQQVPIPQCYKGANAWSIPLNPVISATPIPVDTIHFTRGAIALAVNGVPIFNVHTNTGVDSYVDGQLDNYGGHCGRGDDYHYHIAPLHLYGTTTNTLPIAYALDGFAVYGSVEPDGSSMQTLDVNHGHFGNNGVYHYHGTVSAPYMIKNMVGQVTEDNTHQLIPQAAASPVRTENWTPLPGALITSCNPNGNGNGYNLLYSLNNVPGYATNFSWNASGVYTFTYVTPSGSTIKNYNGFVQCQMVSGINEIGRDSKQMDLFPNPAGNEFSLKLNNINQTSDVSNISIFNAAGQRVLSLHAYQDKINVSNLAKGIYFVYIKTSKNTYSKKLVIE
jgi:hypothetical protein